MRTKKTKNIFSRGATVVFLVLCACLARAETLPFKNYTTAEGLAHERVNRIVRDSRGFLWFCTGEGLSRFDGYEFKNYTQAQGLPHRGINDLLEIENEKYLIATDNGLAVFDPKGKTDAGPGEPPMFRAFRVPFEISDDRPIAILDLTKTRAGKIWAGTMFGLYHVEAEAENFRLEKVEADAWRGKIVEIMSVFEDRFDRLWLGTNAGLYIYRPDTGPASHFPDFEIGLSIVEDDQGRIWSGGGLTKKPGLNLFEVTAVDAPPVPVAHYTTKDGLSDNVWFNALLKTSDGRILVGIRNGLCEFQPDAKPGEPAFRTLFASDIISLAEDGGGNIWVGTGTRGAFKLTRHGFVFYQVEEKPPYSAVTSIFTSGTELFATSSDYDLLRFDGEKFAPIRIPTEKNRNWARNQMDFRSHVDGEWWIPTFAGLARLSSVKKFEDLATAKPKKIYTTADGLTGDSVFNLFEDSRGDVWISTINGVKDRLSRWERKTEKIYRHTTDEGLPEDNAATAFAEDRQGNVWFGFYAGGAARYRDGKFQFFSARTGFPTGYIGAMHVDRAGRLWIATSSNGVIRFDDPTAEDPRYTVLNPSNGLSSYQANCVTEDDLGRIYIGTARGINRIEPDTGRIKLYTQADGLPGSSIGRCTRDAQGNLWFSQKFTIARLSVQAEGKTAAPPVFIGDLRVNGETVRKLSELGETRVENLDLNSEQRQIQINFFALGFSTGETLSYQYKLDHADWSEPSAQRTVNLNLSPGNYNFHVRAVNAEGVASEKPARVSFSIARPFWQQWWFLLLAAIVITAFIYALYRYRVKRLLELERVRTRIATDLHDDIGSSLSQIAILSEVVRQKVGDNGANEPLNLIANTSREMVDSMSDIVWAINPQKDHLSDLVQRMRRFAEDMLDAQEDIVYRFYLSEKSADVPLGADIRREVYLMFKECLNNLVKYSRATVVDLSVQVEHQQLVVSVKDNGVGFDAEEKLNGNDQGFGGNGLPNMRRRTENLGGVLEIESAAGAGASVTIRIPLAGKLKRRSRVGFL